MCLCAEGIWCEGEAMVVCIMRASGVMGVSVCVLRASGVRG